MYNKEKKAKADAIRYAINREQMQQCARDKYNTAKEKERSRRYYQEHKTEHADRSKKWFDRNRKHWNAYRRTWRKNRDRHPELLRLYGLAPSDFDRLIIAQSGRCGICNRVLLAKKNFLCIDHDHQTGQVRGLLCIKCNNAIGMLNDDHLLAQAAAEYLWKHKIPRLVGGT